MSGRRQEDGIAIVGMGALFPGALRTADFWRNLLSGRELMRDVPEGHWLAEDFYDPDPRVPDKVYVKRGAFLDSVDFDPMKYGVPPKLLASTDTCQLLSLMVADQVLRDGLGARFEQISRDRIGCVLGVCSGLELVGEMAGRLQRPAYVKSLRDHGLPEDEVQSIADAIVNQAPEWNESTFPGLLNNVVTGRISNHFDLGGPNFTTDAACASSFASVAMASHMLRQGDADLVIAGGVDTMNDPFTFMCFSKTPALSMSSACRPFSESSDGTMLGEGLGMLMLKRLVDAERDQDRIYAVIRGIGSSSDGRAKSIYAPRWEGQVKSLRRCYEDAGYGPDTVALAEAHGTGTKAGDLAEFKALTEVFGATGRKDKQWCALGSIKSQLGHTKAAAGAAGLMKAVLALHDKVLPPTFGVDKPAAKLDVETTPFYLNTAPRPWIHAGEHPRRAAVSSFGFGGTNFHVTLEEYTGARDRGLRLRSLPTELVLLSGDDRTAVAKTARAFAASGTRPGVLAHIARESQQTFRPDAPARLAVIASDENDLVGRLEQAVKSLSENSASAFSVPGAVFFSERPVEGQIAFLFPGQGSQYVSMGADIASAFDAARAVWDEDANKRGDAALHEIVFPRPVFTDADRDAAEDKLRATEWAQPAIGAVSASLLAILQALRVKPDCVAGHSFGEVSALHAAGALDRESFLRVARERGALMARAAAAGHERGAMTAVSAPIDQIESLLQSYSTEVVIANHNDPKQVVVSGAIAAIEEAERRFAAAGAKVQRLPVATAFHSPIVASSVAPFATALESIPFQAPAIPVFANVTAAPYSNEPGAVRDLLASSIAQRVRFVDVIEAMYARGVRTFIEVGPGAILSAMVKRICGNRAHRALALDRPGRHGVTSLWQCLAELAVAGHPVDFSNLWREFDLGPDPRAEPKPRMTVPISGTNYGKKYPPAGGAASLPRPNPLRAQVEKRANGEVMEHKPSFGPDTTMPRAPAPGKIAARPQENGNGSAHNGTAKAAAFSREPSPAPTNGPSVVMRSGAGAWRGGDASTWLSAYEAIQCRTAEAHALYQQTMAQCHLAFLRAAEQSAMALASLAVGGALPAADPRGLPAAAASEPHESFAMAAPGTQWSAIPSTSAHGPAHAPPPLVPPRGPSPRPPPTPVPVSDGGLAIGPAVSGTTSISRAAIPSAASPTTKPPAAPKAANTVDVPSGGDVQAFLFNVIAEKTGYPVEILNLDQQLEADLGIDSIKRVEILSAFEGQIPDIKDVNLEEVASLSTLRDVVSFMEKFSDKLGLGKKKD